MWYIIAKIIYVSPHSSESLLFSIITTLSVLSKKSRIRNSRNKTKQEFHKKKKKKCLTVLLLVSQVPPSKVAQLEQTAITTLENPASELLPIVPHQHSFHLEVEVRLVSSPITHNQISNVLQTITVDLHLFLDTLQIPTITSAARILQASTTPSVTTEVCSVMETHRMFQERRKPLLRSSRSQLSQPKPAMLHLLLLLKDFATLSPLMKSE